MFHSTSAEGTKTPFQYLTWKDAHQASIETAITNFLSLSSCSNIMQVVQYGTQYISSLTRAVALSVDSHATLVCRSQRGIRHLKATFLN